MNYKYSSETIRGYEGSALAKSEKSDCSVRAFAGVLNTTYEPAHEFVKNNYGRIDKKGCLNMVSRTFELSNSENTFEIEGTKFKFKTISPEKKMNTYKLKGEYIARKKTVKSFLKDNQKGNFLVFVARHVFAIKDGTIIDNAGDEYRPTRKVEDAVEIIIEDDQLSLGF